MNQKTKQKKLSTPAPAIEKRTRIERTTKGYKNDHLKNVNNFKAENNLRNSDWLDQNYEH